MRARPPPRSLHRCPCRPRGSGPTAGNHAREVLGIRFARGSQHKIPGGNHASANDEDLGVKYRGDRRATLADRRFRGRAAARSRARRPPSPPAVTCGPLMPAGSPSAFAKSVAALTVRSAAARRASRVSAEPEAYCSQHPRCPQPQGNPSGNHAHVTKLGRESVGAAHELAVDDHRRAEARADRQHDHRGGALARAVRVLGPPGGVGVVLDHDRDVVPAEELAHLVAQGVVAPGDVGSESHVIAVGTRKTCGGHTDSPDVIVLRKLSDRVGNRRVDARRVLRLGGTADLREDATRRGRRRPRRSWFHQYRLRRHPLLSLRKCLKTPPSRVS